MEVAGLDHGGGKAVILGDPYRDKTPEMLRAYGRFVESLGGRYVTACDVGTYVGDMDVIGEETRWATGRSPDRGGAGDSSVLTAYGETVGHLDWRGAPLRDAQVRLLHDVAGQVGAVVHGARLLGSLQAAREGLVRAREEERRRLRRDLHDGLGPELAALTMRVDTLRNRRNEEGVDLDAELVGLRGAIQSAVASVRRIVEGLRPPALDLVSLERAIAQLLERMFEGSAIACTFEPAGLPARLPETVEITAYRLVQESVTNIVRHAGAGAVIVEMNCADAEMEILVRDDGQPDAFVHISAVERSGLSGLNEGEKYEFDLEVDRRGKHSAVNLVPVQG